MYQPFYNFATGEYTNEIPTDDLDAAMLLPQYEDFQLIYTDLRWNRGVILNSLYTALGDCIRQGCQVALCEYQRSVIEQVYVDYPFMDQGDVPFTSSEPDYGAFNNPYNPNDGQYNGFRPLNFMG